MRTLKLAVFACLSLSAVAFAAGPTTVPTTAPYRHAGEIRRGVVMTADPKELLRRSYENSIRKIEPSLHGDPARLPQYLAFFKREFINDTRLFAFDADATLRADGSVLLTGYAEFPENRNALERFLTMLGFAKVENHIRLLPASELGDRPYAVVKVAHAFLYDHPAAPRETMTQALLGDGLYLLLDTGDGYYLCHSSDGYLGYVAAADVQRVTESQFSESLALPRATITSVLSANGLEVPAGAHLRVVSSDPQHNQVTLAIPDSGTAVLPLDAVTIADEASVTARVAPVLAAARAYLGTPYVWGGKSLEGIDCSGLTQTAFQARGLRLARDTDQQFPTGLLCATRWHRSDLRPGDALFFISQRGLIIHTALYLGDNQYIEAIDAGVQISSFDPHAPNYDPKHDMGFCFAKRLLD